MRNPALTEDRPSVMVVDDEQSIRQLLRSWLTAHGYSIQEARTGKDVLEMAASTPPDVILLDLGLPDFDGVEVTRRLRRIIQTPIIILSVRSSSSDKIAALDAGADDYLTKPWTPADLLARIRAALLRAKVPQTALFIAGGLKVDRNNHSVEVAERAVRLTPREYDLLRVLIDNPGRLLTQERLARDAWHQASSEEVLLLLRATVNGLRQKLEADPAHPRYIGTEPGVGYRLRLES